MADYLTPKSFRESDGVEDWRILGDGANAYFPITSLAEGARFIQGISEIPGIDEHPPDVDLRADGVTVRLITITEDYGGMSRRDLEVARRVSAVARRFNLAADPSSVQGVLVIPGATDRASIMPFWQAVLGYEPRLDSPEEDLVDPRKRNVPLWFEEMQQPRADGGGAIHLAVWIPFNQAEARIASALAAGGHMVRDDYAPSWWTLADPAGNEVDVATTQGRD